MKENTSLPIENLPASSAETLESQFTQDELHSRLIHVEAEGIAAENERHVIEIVDDQVLALRGVRVALTDLKTFIFNIQHLRQGEALTAIDIKNSGFRGGRSTFTRNIRELCQVLNQDPEDPVIERQRDRASSTYRLLPDVKIVDKRQEITAEQKREQFLRDRIAFDEAGKAVIGEDGVVAFKGPKARREVTRLMMGQFASDAEPETKFLEMIAQTVGLQPRTLRNSILPLITERLATPEDERPLLARKEAALRIFVNRFDDVYTPAELEQVLEGVHAIYELFRIYANVPVRTAGRFQGVQMPYEDLYQESAFELLEGILEQPYDDTGKFFFGYIASKRARERVLNRVRRQFAPLSHPKETQADVFRMLGIINEYEERYGGSPSRRTIAQQMGMELDEVEAC